MLLRYATYFTDYFSKYFDIWAIILAIAFGIIWFACFWPPLIKKPWHWAMVVGGGFITLFFVSFMQIPLQEFFGKAMLNAWGSETLTDWLLLSGIPTVFFYGFIQEGAKLIPVVIYWWRKRMKIDHRLGLTLGAAVGVGFGILEAQWIHNLVFAMGWSWDAVRISGIEALYPFIERFFIVAFSTGSTALAGYGLAKGKGWQFYLIVAVLHMLLNYSIFLVQKEILTVGGAEIVIALISTMVIGVALWLRWRKSTTSEDI